MMRHPVRRPTHRPRHLAVLVGFLCALGAVGKARPDEVKPPAAGAEPAAKLFARENLIAWCIVPFDSKKRVPEERAAMLQKLGFTHFAYDWRGEHIPTFDAEVEALKRHGVGLDAFWVAPGELNRESRLILDVLGRHKVEAQLWVLLDFGGDKVTGPEQEKRVATAAAKLKPLAVEAAKVHCSLALYNHGGWFGEPENQLAIVERLKGQWIANVGVVYNLHHGHHHLGRLAEVLAMLRPHLVAVNLNGMVATGESDGRKILPLGQGTDDLGVLRTIRDSGYRGRIGILGHTQDDAEERLRDNLDGLDWLVPQLDGRPAGPRPRPRTYTPPAEKAQASADAARITKLLEEARAAGDARRGAEVFADAKFACVSCHRVGKVGGEVGPDLTTLGGCTPAEQIAESVLWPARQVKEGYKAVAVATADGRVIQGYSVSEADGAITLREAASGNPIKLAKADVEEVRELGTLMPDRLAEAMSPGQLRDLTRFLIGLGRPGDPVVDVQPADHAHAPAAFPFDRKPLHPELTPDWEAHVNRDRVYDFYAKEADYFRTQPTIPPLLPACPDLDGGKYGHWGNQSEKNWVDGRWNQTDLGSLICGGFQGGGISVPKGVCVRLGDRGELSACFNPETLCYEALWKDGFVKTSDVRHGFLGGLMMDGSPLPRPEGAKPDKPFRYHGFYRHGGRVVFAYRLGDVEMLDAPWIENGKFTRLVGPAQDHPLAHLTRGGAAQWPQVFRTRGTTGKARPYAVDRIELPTDNPWKALLFCGDHDFLPDGSALLCTIQGDVWRAEGLDAGLADVRWRRVASGLNQALGLVVADGKAVVLGRDQLTRLHDLDGDGEADFYECVSNSYPSLTAGHDFLTGLQRDAAGNFYSASGGHGLLQVPPDGSPAETLATGFRNPDGLGLTPDGTFTVPCSEGEWSPASMICEVRPGAHYGYGGPKGGKAPDLPLVYLPRGLDNSSGGQAAVPDDRWGPLKGQMVHLSHGAGSYFLLLRDKVNGQPQGAVVPMPGSFHSGAHRARFSPKDGQLYTSGTAGWGTYTVADGSFERVRYTGDPVQLPVSLRAHQNGVLLSFTRPVDRAVAGRPGSHFAQCWNYRYSQAYGSPEFSPRHPGTPGHDPLAIRSATVLGDGRTLFLELPDLQPVNQLQLHLRVDSGEPIDVFATVHALAEPFTAIPNYQPAAKTIAAHPILADLASSAPAAPNPWRHSLPDARTLRIEAGKNLTFSTSTLTARAGESIALTFANPDSVPHNWALIAPGTLSTVGDLANKLISEPDAAARQYIPKSADVLAYTDIVPPGGKFTVSFRAPGRPGRYPFLCTFPGHWMVMNGVLIVTDEGSARAK